MDVVWCGCKAEGKACSTKVAVVIMQRTPACYTTLVVAVANASTHTKTVEDSEGEVEEGSGETDLERDEDMEVSTINGNEQCACYQLHFTRLCL